MCVVLILAFARGHSRWTTDFNGNRRWHETWLRGHSTARVEWEKLWLWRRRRKARSIEWKSNKMKLQADLIPFESLIIFCATDTSCYAVILFISLFRILFFAFSKPAKRANFNQKTTINTHTRTLTHTHTHTWRWVLCLWPANGTITSEK